MRPRERSVAVDGLEFNVAVGGDEDAPTLLLLHGLAARWQVFAPVLAPLAKSWRLVAPDLRGHGKSDRTPGGRYRLEDFVDDVRGVLSATTDGPVAVWGHSLGGWIGLWLAAREPQRVRGLVVGDAAIYPRDLSPDAAVSYLADLPMVMRSLATSLRQLDAGVTDSLRRHVLTAGYRPERLLPHVSCPVLLLQGDPAERSLMSGEDVQHALRLLPDARHELLPGVGHGLHIQAPDDVLAVVTPFLQALPRVRPFGDAR